MGNRRGQIVVEYTLLLVVGVMVAFLISTLMVRRGDDSQGFLIQKWSYFINTIGADPIDE